MNPIRSALFPQHTAVPVNAGQPLRASGPQAQPSHSPKLSLAGMSQNTLDALDQSNQSHDPLAMRAINLIADAHLNLQSAQGADAHYATENGDLTVHARLNAQSRYDVISIGSPNATGAHLIKTAQSLMQYGTLSLFGTDIGQRYSNLMYKASYKPHSPINIENSSYADFLPGQSDLVGEHLEFYKDEFRRGLSGRQEPIIAAPTEQGPLVIVEGHHRLAAALATGMPIKILINADKESAADRDWSNVSKINKDDDGYETDVPSYKQRGM